MCGIERFQGGGGRGQGQGGQVGGFVQRNFTV